MAANEELIIKIKADTDRAIREIDRLNRQVDKLAKSKSSKWSSDTQKGFDGVTKSAGALHKQLAGIATTLVSIEGAKQLVVTTAKLEKGFIGIAKTTGLTGKELEGLQASILDLSTSMAGVQTEELQGIAEAAGQLGIKGSKNILTFTETIAKMGAATDLSAEDAATAMAKMSNSMGLPISDVEKLGSVINELSNNTTATARDLVDVGQRVSGMGKTFGLTADEIMGFSATLKDVGLSSEIGGTAFSKMLGLMLKDVKGFAAASGVSMEQFAETIEKKPVEAIKLFLNSIGKLDKASKIKALSDLKLTSAGAAQTILKLSSNTDLLSKNLGIAAREWQRNTSLTNEYNTVAQGLDAQWTRMGNAFKSLAYKIGEQLLPKLKELTDSTVQWVNSLDQTTIDGFAGSIMGVVDAFAGVGRALSVLNDILMPDWLAGKDAGLIDTAIEGWGRLGDRIQRVGEVMNGIGAASKLEEDVAAVQQSVAAFDGLGSTYDTLAQKLVDLLNKNHELQAVFRDSGSAEAAAQLAALRVQEEQLISVSQQLAAQKPIDAVFGDASKAKTAIRDVAKEAERLDDKGVDVKVDADTESYAAKMARLRKEDADFVAMMTVDADTKPADAKIDKSKALAKKTILTKVKFDADTSAVDAARRAIAQPITVRVNYVSAGSPARTYKDGGAVPQKLATGGVFTGAGRVPGYDPLDRDLVNAKLTGGEYVIRREAVRFAGIDLLNKINRKQLPGYADGGIVGNGGGSVPPAATPVNLHVGGSTFQMVADADVAAALESYLLREGGL